MKIEEMEVYKRGYEKGIKEIKKDLLVLRFVNKTKTSLIRKYTDKLEHANKFIDAADLRPMLKLYINHYFGKYSELPHDSIYLKTQLKALADQESILNTSELTEYFIRTLAQKDRENAQELKKRDDLIRRMKQKQTELTTTMEKHRSNINTLPGLLNSIIEDFILQSEKDKSQERSINKVHSRPNSQKEDVFLTAGPTDEEAREEQYFVNDFTTEFYGQLDDEKRKDLIYKFMSNKLLLFGFREFLLRKLDPTDVSGPELIRGARRIHARTRYPDKSLTSRSELDHHREGSISKSRVDEQKSRSLNNTISGLPRVNKTAGSSKLDESIRPDSIEGQVKHKRRNYAVEDRNQELTMNVLGKRNILRYILKKGTPGDLMT